MRGGGVWVRKEEEVQEKRATGREPEGNEGKRGTRERGEALGLKSV